MRLPTALLISVLVWGQPASAFDDGKDSDVDRADRFDFQTFHKDKAVTLPDSKTAPVAATATESAPATNKTTQQYASGQELKVRSAYKLSVDPSLATIPTLYEAMQSLHQQLGAACPRGWKKVDESAVPESSYYYLNYRAECL